MVKESAPDAVDEASAPAGRGRGRTDLTQGPIASSLVLFALPILGGNLLQSLNGSVNLFWVSRSLTETAISAVGNGNLIFHITLTGIFGIATAANVMIGQAMGARDMAAVKRAMGSAVSFFSLLSLVLAALAMWLTPAILEFVRTPQEARHEATIYLRLMFAAMPFMSLFLFLQMAQRAAGDSRTPFVFLTLAVVLDIAFNPLLIRGIGPFPQLGVGGAAASTLLGQAISLALMVVWVYRRGSPLTLKGGELALLRPQRHIVKTLVMRGMPMALQGLLVSGAVLVVMGLVNDFGPVTVAAYVAATQVWGYVQMPPAAIGAAVSSMAAQNIGADRWDRVDRLTMIGAVIGVVITVVICGLVYLAGDNVLRLFLPAGSPSLAIARHIDHIVLWSFIIFAVYTVLTGAVRATGAAMQMAVIVFIAMWVGRLPFAMLLRPWLGQDAIWWSFPMGTVAASVLGLLYYRFGGWRRVRMRA